MPDPETLGHDSMEINRPNLPHLSPAPKTTQPWFYWALGSLVVAFGSLRLVCCFNDLWLDEIWSLRSVERINSPAQILTGLWHDNNHPLNSLFIYLLAPAKADWIYRLLSWFSGAATIWLAGLIARRQWQLVHPEHAPQKAQTAGLITATIIGGSYLLIHYSSEARGYAPAVGFCFLALYALLRGSGRPLNAWAAVYGLACMLGLLSHLVAFQVLLAGLVWSVVTISRKDKPWRDRLVNLAGWHLVPWTFLGVYYWGFIRKMEIGGGPNNNLTSVLGDLAAYSLGWPNQVGYLVALPIFIALIVFACGLLWRRDRVLVGFYATTIFVAPVLGLWASGFALLFPRYFIISAACALLLGGYALARLWHCHRVGRAACLVLLAGFLIGNGVHTTRLIRYGRGQYRQALQYVAEHTSTATITVSSDYDDRNFCVMEYYCKAVGPGRNIDYCPSNDLPAEGPQWLFLHRLDGGALPPDVLQIAGNGYQLERIFPHAALSGWDWFVYRNLGSGGQP